MTGQKAISYLRVSGRKQITGTGFDRQHETINKFCKENDWVIIKTYQEQVSGTKDETERPVFMEMIADIMSNGVRTIIVESLDRLARAYRVQEQLLFFMTAKGIDLISANTGENISQAIKDDPAKKLQVQIMGCFAEFERSLIAKRLKRGREKKQKDVGRCGGVPRYGSVPEEKQVLLKISYLRRLSKGQVKRRSYQAIAAELNVQNIPTRMGGKWTAQLVHFLHNRAAR